MRIKKRRLKITKQKKGDSQIDWILAGAIFVLFLSYFFMLIRPVLFKGDKKTTLIDLVDTKLEEDLFWTVEQIPLLIHSDVPYDSYAMRVKFSNTNETDKIAFANNTTSFFDGGYFFAVKPVSKNSIYWTVYSNKTYEKGYGNFEIYGNNLNTTTHDLTVMFDNELISNLDYKKSTKIKNMEVYAKDTRVIPETKAYSFEKLLSRHHMTFGDLNNTFYVFSGTPVVDEKIVTQYDTKIKYVVLTYQKFFIDDNINGNISGCFEKTTNSIVFYNDVDGLLVLFDHPTTIKFCEREDNDLDFEIHITNYNETFVRFFFYDGLIDNAFNYQNVTIGFGISKKIKGISDEKLSVLNMSDYGLIKQNWNYPKGKEFFIVFLNSSTTIGKTDTEGNIYSLERTTFSVDKFGNKFEQKYTVATW